MQAPFKTTTLHYKNQTFKVKIYSNVDKIDDFYYYTFDFGFTKIVLSKFDGDKWKIANTVIEDDMAEILSGLLGKEEDS